MECNTFFAHTFNVGNKCNFIVIIVGAIIAARGSKQSIFQIFLDFAIILATVNIFGGFLVTQEYFKCTKRKK